MKFKKKRYDRGWQLPQPQFLEPQEQPSGHPIHFFPLFFAL